MVFDALRTACEEYFSVADKRRKIRRDWSARTPLPPNPTPGQSVNFKGWERGF